MRGYEAVMPVNCGDLESIRIQARRASFEVALYWLLVTRRRRVLGGMAAAADVYRWNHKDTKTRSDLTKNRSKSSLRPLCLGVFVVPFFQVRILSSPAYLPLS